MGVNRRRFLTATLGVAAIGVLPETATARSTTNNVGLADWMSAVSDGAPLDDLTIPGTHDTCALIGGPFDTAKCQDLTLPDQLNGGIRFIDIRCRLFEGAFTIHHGPIYQEKNFSDVLRECRDFLTANPSETVIMSVQQEYSDASDEEFAAVFNDRYMGDEGFDDLLYRENRIPAISEARGKVVLVAVANLIGGIPSSNTDLLSYQNDWEAPTGRKWELISEHLAASDGEQPGATRLFVNYTSTTAGDLIPNPRAYARELNPQTRQYAADAVGEGRRPIYGAVVMDFAGSEEPDLPAILVSCNEGVEIAN